MNGFSSIKTHYSNALAWLAVALLLTACTEAPQSADIAGAGQESYLRYCATCHGNTGEGRPPTFPPLNDPHWARLPGEALALIVLYGMQGEIEVAGRTYRGFMPPMQHMSDEHIAAAVGYLQEQWGGGEATIDADGVAALRDRAGRRSPWRGKEDVAAALDELL